MNDEPSIFLKPKRGREFAHTGERYGMLTLLGVVDRISYKKHKNGYTIHNKFRCQCDCGAVVDKFWTAIISSPYPSCGCQSYPVCKHRENGTFDATGPGSRLPLGPKLLYQRQHAKTDMKTESTQLKAQISRCIGRIIHHKPMFKTTPGSRLYIAKQAVRSLSAWHIKKMVRTIGLKRTVDKIYENL